MRQNLQLGLLALVLGVWVVGCGKAPVGPNPAAATNNMALIPAGSFTMGDTLDGDSGALPLHTNYISAFYMDKCEVTKSQWDWVYQWATNNGYSFDHEGSGKAARHPVQSINWYDCVKWCNARSEQAGLVPAYYMDGGQATIYKTGELDLTNGCVKWSGGFRLPTEAEWEKAARGGLSGKRFPWGDTITHSQANYYSHTNIAYDLSPTRGLHPRFGGSWFITVKGKLERILRRLGFRAAGSAAYTSPAGFFAPNGYGLYDMTGNVWEWCWDWHGLYSSDSQIDPRGPSGIVSCRVLRGGSRSNFVSNDARCAYRFNFFSPGVANGLIGFRCVRGQ